MRCFARRIEVALLFISVAGPMGSRSRQDSGREAGLLPAASAAWPWTQSWDGLKVHGRGWPELGLLAPLAVKAPQFAVV